MTNRSTLIYLLAVTLLCVAAPLSVAEEPTIADVLGSPDEMETAPAPTAPAQTDQAAPPPPPASLRKTDSLRRDSPKSSVEAFVEALNADDYTVAAEYLDLRRLPKGMSDEQGPAYAEQIEVVLERGLWFDTDTLSTEEEGFKDDGLPSYRDLLGTVDLRGTDVDILLQHVPGDADDRVWKVSNVTVGQIPALYKVYNYGRAGEWLAQALPDFEFLGLHTWQWIVLLGLFAVTYLIGYVATWPIFYLLNRRESEVSRHAVSLLALPTRLLIMVILVQHWFYILRPSVEARIIAEANTIFMLILIWFILRVIELVRFRITHGMEARGNEPASVLIRPAATVVKIVVMIVALMVWIENLGFEATTLIAGLGVGGLAVALAAQKSIENLIGGITLYLSAPVKVGDFCKFDGQFGTVEEINLRATRIRTPDDTVIAVPNAIFSDMILENVSKRQKVRYNPHLCLSYEATPEQVSAVLEGIRGELEGRPDIDQENLYVRFEDFGERGLDFKSLIFVTTQDYQEYLGVAEGLNLRIMAIVEKAGTELAEPLLRAVESGS